MGAQAHLALRRDGPHLCCADRGREGAARGQSARSEIPAEDRRLAETAALGGEPDRAADFAGAGMKPELLFLAHRIPYPPDRGDKIRSWHILKHLATLGRVHLACFADDAADAAHLPALREALGGRLGEAHVEVRTTGKAVAGARALMAGRPVSLTLFDSRAMHGFVRGVLGRHAGASVFAFSGQMAQFVPKGVPRFVMDFVDMDSAMF